MNLRIYDLYCFQKMSAYLLFQKPKQAENPILETRTGILKKKRRKESVELIKNLAQEVKIQLDSHFMNSNLFEYSVAILDDSSSFHDRVIITNSQFLTSGNSFGHYFDSQKNIKLRSPTILNLNSHACIYNDTKWSEIASRMLETIKGLVGKPSTTKIGNPLANPLLI